LENNVPDSVYLNGFEAVQISPTASTVDAVAAKIRNQIMRGQLRPGEKLVEGDLCQKFELSRPSLREVLRVLASEKLIELIQNRGPSVATLGQSDVEEIHDVWALITSAMVYEFVKMATNEDISIFNDALKDLDSALAAKDPLGQLNATNKVFRTILSRFQNLVLTEIISSLVSRINFVRAQSLQQEGWGALCANEISDIIAAIVSRNAEEARYATIRHIDSASASAKLVIAAFDRSQKKTKIA